MNCLLLPEGGEQTSKKEKNCKSLGSMLGGGRGMVTSQTEPGINNGNFQKENLGISNCDGN